jgi:P4 family phage/plasmid primase-like protien
MYWPACTIDGEIYKQHNEGAMVDPDELLEIYDDWQDFGSWPVSTRAGQIKKRVSEAEWPLDKPGIIGAFCRTFDIHSAIAKYELPYVPTDFDNRYSPEGSSGAAGAIVYDDVFLYSHHESDVAAQLNLNAFDLVRQHRFHELVANETEDMPMGDRPSFRAMQQLAVSIPEVVREMHAAEVAELPTQQVNGEDHEPDQVMLTFRDLRLELNTLDQAKDVEAACDQMIPKIAAAALSKSENSRLAGILKEQYPDPKPTKKAIEDDIKDAHKRMVGRVSTEGVMVDAERRVIQYALDEHFEGGATLKRFAKLYWTYDRGLWAIDNDERIDGILARTIIRLREERPQDLAELVATVDDRNTSAWLVSLAKVIKGLLASQESRDDPLQLMRRYPLPIINTLNCELWFDYEGKMKRRDHDPDNFFTTRIDAEYTPKAKCPEWDRFCELIFSESSDPEDMQRHLEELCGYAISMSRWLKTWVLFHGPKDTGKSTVAEVLKCMLGDSYLGQEMGRFGLKSNQFTNSALVGKLVLVDDDYAKKHPLPDGFLKTISEEKSMSTEKKYGDVFQFVSRALPIICSNHWPKTSDLTDAIRERALVFPFSHRIAGRDRSDARRVKMMSELPGILNRFMAGIARLRRRGDWLVPVDCCAARDEWVQHSNIVGQWHSERIVASEGKDLKPLDAWHDFERWVRDAIGRGHMQHAPGQYGFYDQLEGLLGVRIPVSGNARGVFRGWSLRVDPRVAEMSDEDLDDWDV